MTNLAISTDLQRQPLDRLVSTKDACAMLGLSRWTIRRRVAEGTFPKPIALSKNKNAFRASALSDWIAAQERGPASCDEPSAG